MVAAPVADAMVLIVLFALILSGWGAARRSRVYSRDLTGERPRVARRSVPTRCPVEESRPRSGGADAGGAHQPRGNRLVPVQRQPAWRHGTTCSR
jgi:hypothetical protein